MYKTRHGIQRHFVSTSQVTDRVSLNDVFCVECIDIKHWLSHSEVCEKFVVCPARACHTRVKWEWNALNEMKWKWDGGTVCRWELLRAAGRRVECGSEAAQSVGRPAVSVQSWSWATWWRLPRTTTCQWTGNHSSHYSSNSMYTFHQQF